MKFYSICIFVFVLCQINVIAQSKTISTIHKVAITTGTDVVFKSSSVNPFVGLNYELQPKDSKIRFGLMTRLEFGDNSAFVIALPLNYLINEQLQIWSAVGLAFIDTPLHQQKCPEGTPPNLNCNDGLGPKSSIRDELYVQMGAKWNFKIKNIKSIIHISPFFSLDLIKGDYITMCMGVGFSYGFPIFKKSQ